MTLTRGAKAVAKWTREVRLAYMRVWNAEHRDYYKEWRRKNQHKERTYKTVRRLKDLAAQDIVAGRPRPTICDICGGSHHNGIVFDHCHQHGHFRGWLCDRCNKTLGAVEDDVALLRKMIVYLERNKTKTSPQLGLPGL